MFLHYGLHGVSCVFLNSESVTAETAASISTKFCSTIKVSKFTSWVVGVVGYLRWPCVYFECSEESVDSLAKVASLQNAAAGMKAKGKEKTQVKEKTSSSKQAQLVVQFYRVTSHLHSA